MRPLILFVCTANICRSPMAAALFEAKMRREGDGQRYRVASAGTWGLHDHPASEFARATMKQHGLSIDTHRGQMVTRELIDEAALVIVMTRDHKYSIAAEFPEARPKIRLLSEFADQQYDISDPYGSTLDIYSACANELAALIERGYGHIADWLLAGEPRPASLT